MRFALRIQTAFTLLLFAALSVQAAPNAQLTQNVRFSTDMFTSHTLQYDFSALQEIRANADEGIGHGFTIDGEGHTGEFGRPMLPAMTRLVVVPPDRGLALEFEASTPRRVRAEGAVEVIRDNPGDLQTADFVRRGLYPAEPAELGTPFVIRGVRVVAVTTYPVQYDYDDNSYLVRDEVTARVVFTDDAPVNPARYPIRSNRSRHFLKFMEGLVINPQDIGRDDPDRDREPPYQGHYLVAMHADCQQYAAPFIEWRRKSGWKVDLLPMSGGDAGNPGTVKRLIQERYNGYLERGIDPFDHLLIIGDHASNEGCGPASQWIVASPRGMPIWGGTDHYDWDYACLEGGQNDLAADVGLARWPSGNADLMRAFVIKHLSYEVTPYRENTDWFTRGAIYAQRWGGNYHVSLATNVRWGKHVLQRIGMRDVRVHENMDQHDGGGQEVGPFIVRQFNDGVNVMIGRAENYYFRNSFPVNRNVIFPIDLNIAGHHEWSTWWMIRSSTPNELKGPVAASTGWGGPPTLFNSIVWLESVNGFLLRDVTWGWARLQGVMGPEGYIPNFGTQVFPQAKTDIMFYGDPAIQWWQGVPDLVDVAYPRSVNPRTKLFEARVTERGSDEPVAGARVTIYNAGNMPAFDRPQYATYDGMFMMTTTTDEEGMARFVLENNIQLHQRTMNLTVSGRNIQPNIVDIAVEVPNLAVGIAEYTLSEVEGNDDDVVNPGETFALLIDAGNLSEGSQADDVRAVITSLSPFVEIEDGEIQFGNIRPGQSARGQSAATLRISPVCPDGASRPITRPAVRVVFSSGENSWTTSIKLNPVAPNFELHRVVEGNIIADSLDNVTLEIRNIGGMNATASTARLISRGLGVSVVEAERRCPPIAAGRQARIEGQGFLIAGNRVVVPGWKNQMAVEFTTDAGFVDTAWFELRVMEPRRNAPQGPDKYGYICFDDTDAGWDQSPTFDWIEISTREQDRDFDGTRLNFTGNSPNNIGETRKIALPFETQFYGHVYDTICVTTNGFITMGPQDYVTNFQNWPMDRCIGGGVGMLAPLWDDLRLADNNSGVYTYYDRDDNRFIIEWHRFTHRAGGNAVLTFQVILYDREVWITESGDQNILFQYLTVSDVAGQDDGWRSQVAYGSVGISSPNGDSGINYRFNNTAPVTSAPLEARRALLFSTSPKYKACILKGRVTDYATGEGVAEATVVTKHGFTAITDEQGFWRINDALAEVPFDITAIKQGYNDSTKYNLRVDEEDSLVVLFELLHPEFTPTTWDIGAMLDPDRRREIPFSLRNTGNGPLSWEVERRLLGDANAAPWEFRRNYNIGEQVNDDRVEGVAFVNHHFYIAAANGGSPVIYKMTRAGDIVDTIPQPREDSRGIRDLAWDGELLWGGIGRTVYGFTVEGEVRTSFDVPFAVNPITSLTYDRRDSLLWVSSTTTDIFAVRRNGEGVAERTLSRRDLRIYGLVYWSEDPEGHHLYVFHKDRVSNEQMLHKFHTRTGDTIRVATLRPPRGGSPGGAFVTNQFDVYSWVFLGISSASRNDGGDRIDIWQVEARKDWFPLDIVNREGQRSEAASGVIQTGESQQFILSFVSAGLPDTLFQGELLFRHNADSGFGHIAVALDVIGPMPPEPFDLVSPANADTLDSTTVNFAWRPSIDYNADDVVGYALWLTLREDTLRLEAADTSFTAMLDTLFDMAQPEQLLFTWWVTAYSGEDSVVCNSPFNFRFIPNELRVPPQTPLEFALKSIYPNPFNGVATITFGADVSLPTTLKVYDLLGRQTAVLFDGIPRVGWHRVAWNADRLPSGVYLVRLESAGRVKVMKTTLIK